MPAENKYRLETGPPLGHDVKLQGGLSIKLRSDPCGSVLPVSAAPVNNAGERTDLNQEAKCRRPVLSGDGEADG